MEVRETKLDPPDEFPFPFTPYSIQKDLMKSLYETLEEKKLGIFESPTGTGKSMSLLCGSLQWLFDAEERHKNDVVANIKELNKELEKSSTGVDWLDEHASKTKIKQKRDALQDLFSKLSERESRLEEIQTKAKKIKEKEKIKLKSIKSEVKNEGEKQDDMDDWEFILDDYTSNDRLNNDSSESEGEAEEKERYFGIKVFFCSRTHSQLSQLVQEVKKSPFKDLNVRVVSLASRQNYCINESVLKLKHLSLINERCQELHKKKTGKTTKSTDECTLKKQKTTAGCPFYNQTNIDSVRLKILTEIKDVEELVHQGRDFTACPYYASRRAIDEAQLVLVPYNTILHRNTREAYGIDLRNSIVIVDEAHNLLDTIGNIHSAMISGLQLAHCYSQLVQYRDKYSERFSAMNLLHLNQLIFVVNKLLRKIGGKAGADANLPSGEKSVTIETLAEFLLSTEIDSINFYKVLEFVAKSNITNKVQGFVAAYGSSVVIHRKEEKGVSAFLKKLREKKEPEKEGEKLEEADALTGNPLVSVINFIQTLTGHCLDGRIVCCKNNTVAASSMKYLLLNPATHFGDIVKEARSVVLAGGTMQPISEFTDQLFYLAGGTSGRIRVFTCGHIIPETNILPIIISSGPSGKVFDFSYQQRNNVELLDELGRLLMNVCNVVPAGIVCFFTSYEYEAFVYQRLLQTKILDRITSKKKVLREPKKSSKVDEILKDYAAAVNSGGALLFSVVGGKLSEGLNFNDDLGRCVIVVGLPYPNLTSLELKEKMNYLDAEMGSGAGKTYYENLCMKAVNQSIGRSVRHKDDYASVLLVDQRYSRPKCVKALPEWIQKPLRKEDAFGPVMSHLGRFFSSKKKST